jgi:hypothetical protein
MNNKSIIVVTLIAIMAFVAGCAGGGPVSLSSPQAPIRTLSASGTGTIYVVPDLAYINIGVRTTADAVSDALEQNNGQAQAIATALTELGVEAKDIQTSSFNVYPAQDYTPDGQISRNYFVVENTVYVTVRDLTKLGKTLDAVVRSGANTINGISFDISNKDEALNQARQQAIEKARTLAKAIAGESGVTLGQLQSINVYTSGGTTPMYDAKGGYNAMAASVPVSAGQLVLTVEANLVYEIK